MRLHRVIPSLLDSLSKASGHERVELLQTHISYIILTPEFVYKIKKPVNFGFLDYSTIEKRRFFCEQEVFLNSRISPDIYIGVVPVVERDGTVSIGGEGRVVEYAVKMKRLPDERMMDYLLRRGDLSEDMVKRLAMRIALFHMAEGTDPHISSFGMPEMIERNTEENFRQTEPFINRTITEKEYLSIMDYTRQFLKKQRELLERRVKGGWIKDCHGDLRSESVCFTDSIVIFDCIEFNERFRYIDTASDIGFLAMDLDFHGRKDLSDTLIHEYKRISKDEGMDEILLFYKLYRAYVRGKVEGFELDEPEVSKEDKKRAIKRAKRFFHLAYRYSQALPSPILVVVCGHIGTGKTSLASEIGRRLNAKIFHSDMIRKELAGIPPYEHVYTSFGSGIYTKEFTDMTYREMLSRAEREIEAGSNVVLDATFGARRRRADIIKMGSTLDIETVFVECTLKEEMIKERLSMRLKKEREVSDGRWEVYLRGKGFFESTDEIPEDIHCIIDTSRPVEECAEGFMKWMGY